MTSGVFAPIYQQVDPIHIGEAERAMSIAGLYGRRLLVESENITPQALKLILSEYPSHSFVIDRHEAELLFANVRGPTPDQAELAKALGDSARWPRRAVEDRQPFTFLNSEPPTSKPKQENTRKKKNDDKA